MKLSVQTGGTVEVLGIDAGFAAIKEAGFDAVDFGFNGDASWEDLRAGKKIDFYENEETLQSYISEVKSASEKYGIAIGQTHAPFPTYIPRSEQGTINCCNYNRKCIELTAKLGCRYIIIHPVFDGSMRFPSLTKEEEYKRNIEFYTSLIPLLKKHNVICCLENMWSQDWKTKKIYTACCSEVNETIRYIDELNAAAGEELFGFCLDTGHLLLLGQNPAFWIERLGSRIKTLHVHDNDGVGDDHTLPYLGCCNWDKVAAELHKIGYDGNFNFETAGFNNKFPSELCGAALKMLSSVGRYLIGIITSEETK